MPTPENNEAMDAVELQNGKQWHNVHDGLEVRQPDVALAQLR